MIKTTKAIDVLIDGPNLHALARLTDRRVNYGNLLSAIKSLREADVVMNARYYTSILPGDCALDSTLEQVRRGGLMACVTPAHPFTKGNGQRIVRGSIDVPLSIDAVLAAHTHVHTDQRELILISGSGAFAPLGDAVRGFGVRLIVISTSQLTHKLPNPFVARDLVLAADEFLEITEIPDVWSVGPVRRKVIADSVKPA